MRLTRYILIAYFCLVQNLAYANENGTAVTGVIEPMSFSSVAQVFAGLVAVLLLFGLVVFVLKRLGGFKTTSGGKMQIVDGLSVGTRERVILMQVGEKQILLGITPQNVNALHVFDETVIETNTASPSGFAGLLQNQLQNQINKVAKKSGSQSGVDHE